MILDLPQVNAIAILFSLAMIFAFFKLDTYGYGDWADFSMIAAIVVLCILFLINVGFARLFFTY